MIRLAGVAFGYRRGRPILDRVTLDVTTGVTLVVGPNGCGKSTLLKLAAGVEKPTRGSVEVAGRDLWRDEAEARRRLAYLPEYPDLTPYATVREVLRLVCRLRHEPVGRADEELVRVGLGVLGDESVRELSMGQRRRALLAAAWIGEPQVIVADEPLESMDRVIRDEIVAWIGAVAARGGAALVATHQVEPFAAMAGAAISFVSGGPLVRRLSAEPAARLAELERVARGQPEAAIDG